MSDSSINEVPETPLLPETPETPPAEIPETPPAEIPETQPHTPIQEYQCITMDHVTTSFATSFAHT